MRPNHDLLFIVYIWKREAFSRALSHSLFCPFSILGLHCHAIKIIIRKPLGRLSQEIVMLWEINKEINFSKFEVCAFFLTSDIRNICANL